jgi:membrane protein YdbS with pleckstrin-like domain
MASNPINLALRFILEIAALFSLGYWGWTQHDGIWRFVWGFGLVVLAAVVWGTFAVPEDPSRSGKAPVPVPGTVRLVIELVLFAAGTWAFFAADRPLWALALGILTVIHYALSYDRIIWLLKR